MQVSLKKIFFASLQSMAEKENIKLKRFREVLRSKYRLILLNDSSFKEKISIKLTPLSLIIGSFMLIIILTSVIIMTVAFSPLRELIPGYGDLSEHKKILRLSFKTDSIEETLKSRQLFLTSILDVLNEKKEVPIEKPKKDTSNKYNKLKLNPTETDIAFRKEFEENKNNQINNVAKLKYKGLSELVFFTPANGYISNSFSENEGHFGIDIVTKSEETIKTTLDGTVIFSSFSAEDGNVIQIQHDNNLITIYKHCSALLKKTGDRVKLGDAIGIVGNSGENSRGPHLHFELWLNGAAINPKDFVVF